MTDLIQRVEQNIRDRRLFKRGARILAAVSGGLDSMALLHLLHALSRKWHWEIVVAHFNHQLRGKASDADENLVRKTAAALRLRVVVESGDVKTFVAKSKLSVEMAARKLRHEFLARAARQYKIKQVALAHHAGDQVELFFLRLLRGAGGDGLAGMKWRSPSPADSRIALVRPLLNLTKEDVAVFARECEILFRDDATNFTTDTPRNRVRNELLPLLASKYQPNLAKIVLRLMEIIGAESEFAGEAAGQWLRNGAVAPIRNGFKKLPLAVQRRILQSQLAKSGIAVDFDLIESLRRSADCFVSVGPNISASRNEAGMVILRADQTVRFSDDDQAVKLGRAGQALFSGRRFEWKIEARVKNPVLQKKAGREFFDADKIGVKVTLRHWRPGDRFQPIGSKSASKLQDLFTNAKIPRAERLRLVVATDAAGQIFWIEGLRIGEGFKLTPRTKRCLAWRWQLV